MQGGENGAHLSLEDATDAFLFLLTGFGHTPFFTFRTPIVVFPFIDHRCLSSVGVCDPVLEGQQKMS
jgi:hypothetical protein